MIISLIIRASVFLLHPRLLLYLSLFGFTLEPRCYRERYKPPRTFLEHLDFSSPSRQSYASEYDSHHLPRMGNNVLPSSPHAPSDESSSSPLHSKIHKKANSTTSGTSHQNGPNLLHHRHKDHSNDLSGKVTNHIPTSLVSTPPASKNHVHQSKSLSSPPTHMSVGLRWSNHKDMSKFVTESSLLLPSSPDEVREEVDLLLSDLMVRLKQLLFNSLLCAYYVGFIPMQFADVSAYVIFILRC